MSELSRIFVICGHTASLTPNFTLNDLPGSAGRMDILARFITASFCLSHGIRKDVEVWLILQDQVALRIEGWRVKRLNPDERSTGALIKHALEAFQSGNLNSAGDELESTPGIFVSRRGLKEVLEDLRKNNISSCVLDEKGTDLRATNISKPIAFVLSDHQNFTPHEDELLKNCEKISLGPVVLHADHCVSVVHNELDRRETC